MQHRAKSYHYKNYTMTNRVILKRTRSPWNADICLEKSWQVCPRWKSWTKSALNHIAPYSASSQGNWRGKFQRISNSPCFAKILSWSLGGCVWWEESSHWTLSKGHGGKHKLQSHCSTVQEAFPPWARSKLQTAQQVNHHWHKLQSAKSPGK